MPYAVNEDGYLTTPGGCKPYRGRCFDQIALNYSQQYIRFVLNAVEYFYSGTGSFELFLEFTTRWDPGCVWNKRFGWNKPTSGMSKARPYSEPESDIWLVADPPQYIPKFDTGEDG